MLSNDEVWKMLGDVMASSGDGTTAERFARAVEARARRDALEEAAKVCANLSASHGAAKYLGSSECLNAIRTLIDHPAADHFEDARDMVTNAITDKVSR